MLVISIKFLLEFKLFDFWKNENYIPLRTEGMVNSKTLERGREGDRGFYGPCTLLSLWRGAND